MFVLSLTVNNVIFILDRCSSAVVVHASSSRIMYIFNARSVESVLFNSKQTHKQTHTNNMILIFVVLPLFLAIHSKAIEPQKKSKLVLKHVFHTSMDCKWSCPE